ncbi:unnamed protein product [Choristocarpus tenellus]
MAISLNPSCTVATQGLERLEKLMRGVDPDADDGQEEGEVALVDFREEGKEKM